MRPKHKGECLPGFVEEGKTSEHVERMSENSQLEGLKVFPSQEVKKSRHMVT